MAAKIHVESSRCPINKWGPELQTMNSPEQVNDALTRVQPTEINEQQRKQINPQSLSEESLMAFTITNIVNQMSMDKAINSHDVFERTIQYKGNSYMIKRIKPPTPVVIEVGAGNNLNFDDLVKKHSDPLEPKTFDFNNEQYFVDTDSNKNEPPRVFKINKQIMQHAFSPVDILDKK